MYKQEDIDRFWSKVNKDDSDCWNWNAYYDKDGYGQIKINGKNMGAHRVAFEIYHNQKIKEGMFILHSCDNRKCVNPAHLREGTQQENINDKVERGRCRNGNLKGEAHGSSKLTQQQVNEIRERYAVGNISQKELGEEYGVKQTTICDIIRFKLWKD